MLLVITVGRFGRAAALPFPLARLGRAARWCAEAPVLTVGADVVVVERRLVAGELACPGCAGVLARWVGCLAFSGQARLWLIHAASCRFSNSFRTCRGVLYPSSEWRLREL